MVLVEDDAPPAHRERSDQSRQAGEAREAAEEEDDDARTVAEAAGSFGVGSAVEAASALVCAA